MSTKFLHKIPFMLCMVLLCSTGIVSAQNLITVEGNIIAKEGTNAISIRSKFSSQFPWGKSEAKIEKWLKAETEAG